MVFNIKESDILKSRMTSGTLMRVQFEINRLALGTMTGNVSINQTMLFDRFDIQPLKYTNKASGHKGRIIPQNTQTEKKWLLSLQERIAIQDFLSLVCLIFSLGNNHPSKLVTHLCAQITVRLITITRHLP
jgi:hypothetical protein